MKSVKKPATKLHHQPECMMRCSWAGDDLLYIAYHDDEWGVPVYEDRKQFEFLILESAQAGLSWITILKRRESYRCVFHDFDPVKVAAMTEIDVQAALQDKSIIRNKLKVRAAVQNAQVFLAIQAEYGTFSKYIWTFVGGMPILNKWQTQAEVPATSVQSEALSRDLKKRGMSFVGPTIMYSHMQATGLVNDHTTVCFRYNSIDE